jgi:hypothetical protein
VVPVATQKAMVEDALLFTEARCRDYQCEAVAEWYGLASQWMLLRTALETKDFLAVHRSLCDVAGVKPDECLGEPITLESVSPCTPLSCGKASLVTITTHGVWCMCGAGCVCQRVLGALTSLSGDSAVVLTAALNLSPSDDDGAVDTSALWTRASLQHTVSVIIAHMPRRPRDIGDLDVLEAQLAYLDVLCRRLGIVADRSSLPPRAVPACCARSAEDDAHARMVLHSGQVVAVVRRGKIEGDWAVVDEVGATQCRRARLRVVAPCGLIALPMSCSRRRPSLCGSVRLSWRSALPSSRRLQRSWRTALSSCLWR